MIHIQSFSDTMFLVDGITHYRKFFSNVRAGNFIRVYNAFNPIDVLVDYVKFDQIELDGVVYPTIEQLQTALLEVIFVADFGSGSGSFNQNNIPIAIPFNYSGEPTEQNLALGVNSLPSFIISERQIPFFLATNPSQPIEQSRKITFVLKNVGKGNYGQGGTVLTADNIMILAVGAPNIYDILPNPRTQVIDLGVITGDVSQAVNALNPPVEVQGQADGYVVFKAKIDVNDANYLFLADGGVYGTGATQTTLNDFLLLQGGANFVGIEEAPADGQTYGRKNLAWTLIESSGGNQDLQSVVEQGGNASVEDGNYEVRFFDGSEGNREISFFATSPLQGTWFQMFKNRMYLFQDSENSGLPDGRMTEIEVIDGVLTIRANRTLSDGNSGDTKLMFQPPTEHTIVHVPAKTARFEPDGVTPVPYVLATLDDLPESEEPQIIINTTTNISINTLNSDGKTQQGKNVVISNGSNVINLVVDAFNGFVASYVKHGVGKITFVQGSGRVLVQVDGTAIFDGNVGSTATISSVGNVDYLRISNV